MFQEYFLVRKGCLLYTTVVLEKKLKKYKIYWETNRWSAEHQTKCDTCTCNWFAALQKLPEKSLSIAECLPQLSMLITKLLKILTENSLLMAQCVRFRNPLKTSPNAPSPILYSSLKPFVAWLSSLVVKLWVPTRATATSMSHPPSLASEE